MAVTRGTLQIMRRLRRDIGTEVDSAVRSLTSDWVREWDSLAPAWHAAAVELVGAAVALERWPAPMEIMRGRLVDQAMRGTIAALDKLVERIDTVASEGADRVVHLDAEREGRIIASQAPDTEQPALARLLGRATAEAVLAREDARADVEVTVASRIRTDAVNVMAARAGRQIHSDTLPLSPQAVDAIRRELIAGIDVGANPRTAAARMVATVEGQFNGGLTRAMNIARTEMLDAYRATSQQIHATNADIVPAWQWLATFDTRVCPSCISMHGSEFPVTEPGPQDHQQGRCARLPVLAPWSQLGITAPEPPSALPNAQEWFSRLSHADQLRIMGPGRLQLLDDGAIGWDDLSMLRQTPGWRPSRVPTPLRNLRQQASLRGTVTPVPTPQRAAPRPTAPPALTASQQSVRSAVAPSAAPFRDEIVPELDRQAELTPLTVRQLQSVEVGGPLFAPGERLVSANAYYEPWNRTIRLHHQWIDMPGFNARLKQRSIDSGWSTPTGAPTMLRSVLAHEYGHHVHRMMQDLGWQDFQRFAATVGDELGIRVDVSRIASFDALTEQLEAAIRRDQTRVSGLVSEYGASNAVELLAEIWQEYSTRGSAARPHIRAIGELMRELAELSVRDAELD